MLDCLALHESRNAGERIQKTLESYGPIIAHAVFTA